LESISIIRRFCGPPESGNGGYVAGMVANLAGRPVSVTLRKPPPLDVPLAVRRLSDHRLELRRDGQVIVEAEPGSVALEVPVAPSYLEALNASRSYLGFKVHPFPTCFVCGPQRARGDGLRIFPGALPASGLLAAPWLADESLSAEDGKIRTEFMWAALDCPGWFAAQDDGRVMLLGRIAAQIDRRVHAAESCVVVSWRIGAEGRKHYVGTALFDEDGECCARARATWIEPSQDS